MQEENILNVLMYLFKHHMESGSALLFAPDKLSTELESAGFSKTSIRKAFQWLEQLSSPNQNEITAPQTSSLRLFHGIETDQINVECQEYLRYLSRINILDNLSRERVINQLVNLKNLTIDISLIKWVTLLVLYNRDDDGAKKALEQMELLVLNDNMDTVH